MASTTRGGGSGDMKGFYRQRKKAGDITNHSKGRVSSSSSSSNTKSSATLDSDIAQSAALDSRGSLDLNEDYDANEEVLRQFDMNMAYGPCVGMTRLGRWERANTLGLNPPKEVERLLKVAKVRPECLWDARV